MLKGIVMMVFSLILCAGNPLLAAAQEEGADVGFSSGTVIEVAADSLTVEDYGASDQKVFMINNETALENIESIDQLVVGDNVFIDFIEENGKNIALSIFKSSVSYDEESSDGSGDEIPEDNANEQEDQE
jgi:hypothetical protein